MDERHGPLSMLSLLTDFKIENKKITIVPEERQNVTFFLNSLFSKKHLNNDDILILERLSKSIDISKRIYEEFDLNWGKRASKTLLPKIYWPVLLAAMFACITTFLQQGHKGKSLKMINTIYNILDISIHPNNAPCNIKVENTQNQLHKYIATLL